jgi:hypothetical protein
MKKFAWLLPWLVAVSALGQTWKKEPETYRGVKWGSTEKEAVSFITSEVNGNASLPCYNTDVARGRRCDGWLMLGNVSVTDHWIFSNDDRLIAVYWDFKSADYASTRDVFLDKYGPPMTTKNEKVKTKMGVEYDQERLIWMGRQISISLSRFGSDIEKGTAAFTDNEFLTKFMKEKADAQTKAKDAF